MTTATSVQWRKEVRELLPWWAATVITMAVCWALMRPDAMPFDQLYKWAVLRDRHFLLAVGLCAYSAGAVTLGALSLGQEYAHQTLATLLTHPISRGRLLLMKLTVLATMLAALGALAFGAWGSDPILVGEPGDVRMLLPALLPLVSGLFLAPWLTMVGRGPLAGAVFTLVLPSLVWVVGSYLGLPAILSWLASVVLAAFGGVMTWRTFVRLEAAGGPQADIDLSAWFTRSADSTQVSRRQKSVWLLVKKELRLQQATFVVSGLYVGVWVVVIAGRQFAPEVFPGSLYVATFLNTALVPVLAGALASAEERQLGTADWHNLLPIAAWKQWAVKSSVALGLAFALAVVLPTLLAMFATETGWRDGMEPATVVALCIAALYVSSLSTNGLRALLVTGPAIAVAVASGLTILWPLIELALPALLWLARALQPIVQMDRASYQWWMGGQWLEGWLAGGFALLLWRFAFTNHRTAGDTGRRVARQLGFLSAYAVGAGLFMSLIGQMYYVWLWLKQGTGR